jgi:acetyl-CoA carboxylase carboxyltransferase component
MGAGAQRSAMGADDDVEAALREAELAASYGAAATLGLDELLDPTETRDALVEAIARAVSARQAPPQPVMRQAITP